MQVRAATELDIPVLMTFQQAMALETENIVLDENILRLGLHALFSDPTKGKYYVVEADGAVVGCHMVTYEWSDWRNGTVWWLQSVYVREDYRKSGVFKFMFANLKALANQDPSVRGLRLYVDKTNVRAQQVYTALGMNGEHYTVFEWMKD